MAKPRISWWAPRWSYAPRTWREYVRLLRDWKSHARVHVISSVACLAIVGVVKWRMPLLQLNFLWKMLLAVPGLYVYLACMTGLYLVIPPNVVVRADTIHYHHGEFPRIIKPADLRRAWLFVHAPDRIRLKIRYRQRETEKTLSVGVPATVDLEKLAALLPIELLVRDARGRTRPAGLRAQVA